MSRSIGDILLSAAKKCKEEIFIVSPFIKQSALERLLNDVDPNIRIVCVTRWYPEEIKSGISDIEIWSKFRGKFSWTLRLQPDLHAKYYRFDKTIFVGSANLTSKGLGWCSDPNFELIVDVSRDSELLKSFEEGVLRYSTPVDQETYIEMSLAVNSLPELPPKSLIQMDFLSNTYLNWTPKLKFPEKLYASYLNQTDKVIESVYEDAQSDLANLSLPPGLIEKSFNGFVSIRIQSLPIFKEVEARSRSGISLTDGQNLIEQRMLIYGNPDPMKSREEWLALKGWILYFLRSKFREKNTDNGPVLERSTIVAT